MSPRHRVLFVSGDLAFGGMGTLLGRHLRRLAPHYDIDVLLGDPVDPAALAELPSGVNILRFHPRRRRLASRLWLAREPLAAWHPLPPDRPPFTRRYRATFVIVGEPYWRGLAALGQIPSERRYLIAIDNSLALHRFFRARERAAIAWGLRQVDCFLPVSSDLWRELVQHCPPLDGAAWQVIRPPLPAGAAPSGASPPPSPYPSAGVPVVLTIARLVAGKNVAACVRAHARLRADGLDFRWYVIGSGPEESALRAEIARLGLGEVFFLVGRQESVEPWLRHCDVFALFSEREGCPTVVREALQAGRPVVTTDVNGVQEMIDHGRTGLIVAHDDAAIAAGLGRLLLDAALRDTLRRNLAMSAAESDPGRETAQLAALIESPPPPPPPRVSILIPTFNQAGFIDRAIASALAQDFPALEVIVSDDASTDDTGDRARAWEGHPRFRYHRNATRLGHTGNYRRLLGEFAGGDWVLMLDGDDHLIDPGFVRQALAAIAAHPGKRIVFAQAGQRVVHPADLAPTLDLLPPIDAPARLVSGGDYLRLLASGPNFFSHLGTLYDRRAALAIGFYTSPLSASDQDSILRLALEGDVLLLRTVAGCWVHHGTNLSDNVPLAQVAPNARVFRSVTAAAARRGLVSASQIEGPLTRCEATTLAYLCGRALAHEPPRLRTLFRLLGVVIAVNPRLLLRPALLRVYYDFLCQLTGFPPRHPFVLAVRRACLRLRRPLVS